MFIKSIKFIYLISIAGFLYSCSGLVESGGAILKNVSFSLELKTCSISAATSVVAKGRSVQYIVKGNYNDAIDIDITNSVSFRSSDDSIASVSVTGEAQGLMVGGPVTITATKGNVECIASLMVAPAVINSCTVFPANTTLLLGQSVQYSIIATYSDSTIQTLMNGIAWSTPFPNIASIDSSGLVSANSGGIVPITGTIEGISCSTLLNVNGADSLVSCAITPSLLTLLPGNQQQFTATGTYASGAVEDLTASVTWNSSNPQAAFIMSGPGATGGQAVTIQNTNNVPGSSTPVTISAQTSNNILCTTATLNVGPEVLNSCSLNPSINNPAAYVGETQQYIAAGAYSNGVTQSSLFGLTWSLNQAAGYAIISSTGLATALQYDTARGVANVPYTVNATLGDVVCSPSSIFQVRPPILISCQVSPASTRIEFGQTELFTATGTYSDSSTKPINPNWTTNNAAIATVRPNGIATGVGVGSTDITALLANIYCSANLEVTAAPCPTATASAIDIVFGPGYPSNPNVISCGKSPLNRTNAVEIDTTFSTLNSLQSCSIIQNAFMVQGGNSCNTNYGFANPNTSIPLVFVPGMSTYDVGSCDSFVDPARGCFTASWLTAGSPTPRVPNGTLCLAGGFASTNGCTGSLDLKCTTVQGRTCNYRIVCNSVNISASTACIVTGP